MTQSTNRTASPAGELARGLRDGLLQDLLAVSMLIEGARARVGDHDEATADELLHEAGATIRADIDAVRALIARLTIERAEEHEEHGEQHAARDGSARERAG